MKKKVILGIIITLLVIAVIAEGVIIFLQYKKNEDNTNKQDNEKGSIEETIKETPTTKPTVKPTQVPKPTTQKGENLTIKKEYFAPEEDELVYTYMNVKIEEENYGGYVYIYSYEIPQININSKDVDRINKEILEKWEKIFDKMEKEDRIDFSAEGLNYVFNENEDVLSIVLTVPCEAQQYIGCDVYNIDISTEKEISEKELIQRFNFSNSELKEMINEALAEEAKELTVNMGIYYEELIKEIESGMFDPKVHEEKLFINNKGNISAFIITSRNLGLAGGDGGNYLLDLETKKSIFEKYVKFPKLIEP